MKSTTPGESGQTNDAKDVGEVAPRPSGVPTRSTWSQRYGENNRYIPIVGNPFLVNGRRGKVKVYQRGPHIGAGPHRFVLEWREGGKNTKVAVWGDVLNAIKEADSINERLEMAGRSGKACKAIMIPELVRRYLERLIQRANAHEVRPATVQRYRTALQKLVDYAESNPSRAKTRAGAIDSEFVLDFKSYLHLIRVHSNGHPNSEPRPMDDAGVRFVLSAAKAAWNWASGNTPPILPEGLRNPFSPHVPSRPRRELVKKEQFPTSGIVRSIGACDVYQLGILAPLMLYGLRAAEPRYLLIEQWRMEEDALEINCIPGLEYVTKGGADKRFFVPPALEPLLRLQMGSRQGGPLFVRRALFEKLAFPKLVDVSENGLISEYRRRVKSVTGAAEREEIRECLMTEAGAVTYEQISAEFRAVAAKVGLGDEWTLKALRHHFASNMEKSNVSYFTRKYLMGHQVPLEALGNYTSIEFEDVQKQFQEFLGTRLAPVVQAIQDRVTALGLSVQTVAA